MKYEIGDNFNLNFENHKKLCNEIHELYKLKNANYGNSFSELFEEFEMLYVVPRLVEKINRIKTLTMNKDLDYDDESIRDSLLDLANYSIMTVMELDKGDNIEDIRKIVKEETAKRGWEDKDCWSELIEE